jgi:hypothetical protein
LTGHRHSSQLSDPSIEGHFRLTNSGRYRHYGRGERHEKNDLLLPAGLGILAEFGPIAIRFRRDKIRAEERDSFVYGGPASLTTTNQQRAIPANSGADIRV